MRRSWILRARLACASLLASGILLSTLAAPAAQQPVQCTPTGSVARVHELPEGSGLAASRTAPDRFWSHNDSGEPTLFALDANGRVTGRLALSGARVEDWEAVAVGPCPSGSCIYVADIGDNEADRAQITIYRVAEPTSLGASPAAAEAFHAQYPDGAHDAEALLVTADGRIHIVTKGDTGSVSLYRFPNPLRANATMRLERIGQPRDQRDQGAPRRDDRITDGAVSPDGRWVILRRAHALTFYRAADLLGGTWREAGTVSLASLGEPQGEGVTFGSNTTVYVSGEGGGKKQPGTFARLTCVLQP
jgi:hypothetical protein